MKLKLLLFYNFIFLFIIGCAAKQEVILNDDKKIILEEEEKKYQAHNDPFYPLKDSMEDLQYQINELRAQVHEYETNLHAPSLNSELLKLIKAPNIEHELLMQNGTIIQGKIINEDSERMIVQTQIGQLKIDKQYVVSIKNIDPLVPKIEFIEEKTEEKISKTNLTFSGEVMNIGGKRGDYIRIIYKLWKSETEFILSDSTFINGNHIIYNNNVISNACLDPGETGTFNLSINISDSTKVSYWTKDIQFDIFE